MAPPSNDKPGSYLKNLVEEINTRFYFDHARRIWKEAIHSKKKGSNQRLMTETMLYRKFIIILSFSHETEVHGILNAVTRLLYNADNIRFYYLFQLVSLILCSCFLHKETVLSGKDKTK